jgi:four helix bundle protein
MSFDHDRYPVYNLALSFVALAEGISEELAPRRARLADQLARASYDVALHIAEGACEPTRAGRRRLMLRARASASEGAAILDVCERVGALEGERHREGKRLLGRLVVMLAGLAAELQEPHRDDAAAVRPWFRTGTGDA